MPVKQVIKLRHGNKTDLSTATLQDYEVALIEDDKSLYFGKGGDKFKISDIVIVEDENSLPSVISGKQDKVYLIKNSGRMKIFNGSNYEDFIVESKINGWTSLKTYKVGECVVYASELWQCVNEHTSTTNFADNIADWQLIGKRSRIEKSIYPANSPTRTEAQSVFEIPEFNSETDKMMVSRQGIETSSEDGHYVVIDSTHINFSTAVEPTEEVYIWVFKNVSFFSSAMEWQSF